MWKFTPHPDHRPPSKREWTLFGVGTAAFLGIYSLELFTESREAPIYNIKLALAGVIVCCVILIWLSRWRS
jgi:hypothetical protein